MLILCLGEVTCFLQNMCSSTGVFGMLCTHKLLSCLLGDADT